MKVDPENADELGQSQCARCNQTAGQRCLCLDQDAQHRAAPQHGSGGQRNNKWGDLDSIPTPRNSNRQRNNPDKLSGVLSDLAHAQTRSQSTKRGLGVHLEDTPPTPTAVSSDHAPRLHCLRCERSFRRSDMHTNSIAGCPMCRIPLVEVSGNRHPASVYLEQVLQHEFEIAIPQVGYAGLPTLYIGKRKSDGISVIVKLITLDQGYGTGIDQSSIMEQAKTHLQLDHPNLTRTLAIAPCLFGLIIVTEYVRGVGLDSYLLPLQIPESVQIVTKATAGLHELHSNNLLHGDLSPRDIRITSSGKVKIVGFSPARTRYHSQQTCINGSCTSILGWSPTYAAPEGTESGPLCDIYALGGILFHCATGKQPFSAANQFQVGLMHQLQAPPRVEEACPALPQARALDEVIGRCMKKNPADRFTDMNDLREQLQKITWT